MSIKACQKMQMTYGVAGWDSTIGHFEVKDKMLCAEGATQERARTALTQVIRGVCNDTAPKTDGIPGSLRQLQKCDSAGPVTVTLEKPNWLQRAGIKISDLWNRIVD